MLPIHLAFLLAITTTPAAAAVASGSAATTPTATLPRLAEAYEARSLTGLDALLTADFRFHFSGGDAAGSRYAEGWTRNEELRSARSMFHGVPGSALPRADSIFVSTGVVDAGVDPEHPDSTCQYRLAIARGLGIRLVMPNGRCMTPQPAVHVFHVVRGDAAVLMPGQPADTTRWYIRRWLEDLDAITIALGAVDGECGSDAAADAPLSVAPERIGLRAISAPVCATLKVLCDLPGNEPASLEVFDVQGRRVAQRSVTPQSPGSVLVEAGSGQRFAPGAYWVRLAQGTRPPVTRMVMVAR
jgi:hypothetical protein